MQATVRDRTIALAGIIQATTLVHQVATQGQCSLQAAEASIQSLFNRQPETPEQPFGGPSGLRLGFTYLTELLGSGASSQDIRILHYALAVLKLTDKIRRNDRTQQELGHGLDLIRPLWAQSPDPTDISLITQLGDVYQQHVSTLSFRITVQGNPNLLKKPEKVAWVRAFLLCAVRSAFLWRQLGGNQWRLMLQRKAMVDEAQRLI